MEDRLNIIEWCALVSGTSTAYYEKLSNRELEIKYTNLLEIMKLPKHEDK